MNLMELVPMSGRLIQTSDLLYSFFFFFFFFGGMKGFTDLKKFSFWNGNDCLLPDPALYFESR